MNDKLSNRFNLLLVVVWVVGSCRLGVGLVIQTHVTTNYKMCLIKLVESWLL
jgi:hypothetical protein